VRSYGHGREGYAAGESLSRSGPQALTRKMAIARHGMAQHYRLRLGGGLSLLTSAVAVLILGAAAQSRADTITVTGGSAGFDEGDPPRFHLILDEGELSGGFFLGGMILNFPVNSAINCLSPSCQPGDTVSLAAEWTVPAINSPPRWVRSPGRRGRRCGF
jgi:hypothetical protein